MAVLSLSEIFNLDVDMAGMYRRAMDVQGRKCATREGDEIAKWVFYVQHNNRRRNLERGRQYETQRKTGFLQVCPLPN
jgi:hypothetical protein